MDPWDLRLTQNAYFTLLHIKQLLLVISCDTAAGIGASFWTHERKDGKTDGQTGMKVEIAI